MSPSSSVTIYALIDLTYA